MNSTDIGTVFLDRSLRVKLFTSRARDIFNLIPADTGRPLADLTSKLDGGGEGLVEDAGQVLERLHTVEREVRTRGGGWYLMRLLPYRTSEDHIEGVVITFLDITRRIHAEESLREARASLEFALEAASLGAWDVDLTTGTARTSLRHNQIFGYPGPAESWGPDLFRQHIIPEDLEKFEAAFDRAMKTGAFDLQVRVRWPDGSVHWVRDRGRVEHDLQGRPRRMAGVTVDLTERKEMDGLLLASEERMRLLLDSATDYAIFSMDASTDSSEAGTPGAETSSATRRRRPSAATPKSSSRPKTARAGPTRRRCSRRARRGARTTSAGTCARTARASTPRACSRARRRARRGLRQGGARPHRQKRARRSLSAAMSSERRVGSGRRSWSRRTRAGRGQGAPRGRGARAQPRRPARHRAGGRAPPHLARPPRPARPAVDRAPARARSAEGRSAATGGAVRRGRGAASAARAARRGGGLPRVGAAPDRARRPRTRRLARPTSSAEWSKHYHVPAEFHDAGLGDARLPPQVETCLYRIAQEALNNVYKHAQAARVSVILERRAGEAVLVIEDDGVGFDPTGAERTRSGRGLGLIGMRERAALARRLGRVRERGRQGHDHLRARPCAEARQRREEGTTMSKIRVLLAEDHRTVREGFKLIARRAARHGGRRRGGRRPRRAPARARACARGRA